MRESILKQLDEHCRVARELAAMVGQVDAACRMAIDTLRSGHKLLLMGNGGSAADAQHIAAELTGRFQFDRPGLPAIALACDTSALTAIANDFGFEQVFSRQIEALARRGDLVVGISTSGNSPNVVSGLRRARALGCRTLGLSGKGGGALAALCDVALIAPSDATARIQEMHILLGHIVCDACETALFANQRMDRPHAIAAPIGLLHPQPASQQAQ